MLNAGDFQGFLAEELDGLPLFFGYPGKFDYHIASQVVIRFECKEYQ